MAQRARNAGPTPSPARLPAAAALSGATPMAHPEPAGWDGEAESYASYDAPGAGRRYGAGAATPGTSVLSASSLSPPKPLVLLGMRPVLGRVSEQEGGGLPARGLLRGQACQRISAPSPACIAPPCTDPSANRMPHECRRAGAGSCAAAGAPAARRMSASSGGARRR